MCGLVEPGDPKFYRAAVDGLAIDIEYCVVVPVLYLNVHDKFVSGERADRRPLFGSGLAISHVTPCGTG